MIDLHNCKVFIYDVKLQCTCTAEYTKITGSWEFTEKTKNIPYEKVLLRILGSIKYNLNQVSFVTGELANISLANRAKFINELNQYFSTLGGDKFILKASAPDISCFYLSATSPNYSVDVLESFSYEDSMVSQIDWFLKDEELDDVPLDLDALRVIFLTIVDHFKE